MLASSSEPASENAHIWTVVNDVQVMRLKEKRAHQREDIYVSRAVGGDEDPVWDELFGWLTVRQRQSQPLPAVNQAQADTAIKNTWRYEKEQPKTGYEREQPFNVFRNQAPVEEMYMRMKSIEVCPKSAK